MFLFNFSDSVCSRSTHNKPCCVCFCFLGGQWSRWRFQCEHGLYWRAGSAHEWCRVFSCIQVRHSYHFVTEWANSKCKFPVVLSVLEVSQRASDSSCRSLWVWTATCNESSVGSCGEVLAAALMPGLIHVRHVHNRPQIQAWSRCRHVPVSYTFLVHTAGKKQTWICSSTLWRWVHVRNRLSIWPEPDTSNQQAAGSLQL